MTLEDYRRMIREKWLPLTGRKKLSTSDYGLIQQWFNDGVPVDIVLRAINQARRQCKTLYALGYLSPHVARLVRVRKQSKVGAPEDGYWREKWGDDLEELAETNAAAGDPETAAMYRELRRALPELSLAEAQRRWREINHER